MLLVHGLDVYLTNDMPCVTSAWAGCGTWRMTYLVLLVHGLDVYLTNDVSCVTSAWAGCVLNQ